MPLKLNPYAEPLIGEWGLTNESPLIKSTFRMVLNELSGEALLTLRREPRLEVHVTPNAPHSVWAYFPVHGKRRILKHLAFRPEPETLIVLAVSPDKASPESFEHEVRDHIGHALLYLRDPKASNECADAMREFRENMQPALIDSMR